MSLRNKTAWIAFLNHLYEQHYAEPLRKAGFVPQGKNLIDWYRIENDILYGVHLSIQGTPSFMDQNIYITADPLFVWNEIPPGIPTNDYSPVPGAVRINISSENKLLPLYESWIGPLKRSSYHAPARLLALPFGGSFLMMTSEQQGAEVLEEVGFPLMKRLNSVEAIYRFHLEEKLLHDKISPNKPPAIDKVNTIDEYIEWLKVPKKEYGKVQIFSVGLAEECISIRDEKAYPVFINSLLRSIEEYNRMLNCPIPGLKIDREFYNQSIKPI